MNLTGLTDGKDSRPNFEAVENQSEFLELFENASTCFFIRCSSFLIYLFFSFIWLPISRTRTYPSSVFMTLSSHSFLSPPRSERTTHSLFSFRSQNASPAHSRTNHELSPPARGMSRSVSSPDVMTVSSIDGRTVFYELPPILYPKERIRYKDSNFKPSCLPALPRRRVNKKGGISASLNQSKGQVVDLEKKRFFL